MCVKTINKREYYIAVCCGFQQFRKHLYLASCLNAYTHNTYIHLPQNCAKDDLLHYLSILPNTSSHRCRLL